VTDSADVVGLVAGVDVVRASIGGVFWAGPEGEGRGSPWEGGGEPFLSQLRVAGRLVAEWE
jgi:hypothetical protein